MLPGPPSAKSFDHTGNVLYCSSFSKTLSPAFRIGWNLAGRFQESLKYQKFLDNLSTAVHPQLVAKTYQPRMALLRRCIAEKFPVSTHMSNPAGGYDCMTIYRNAMAKKIAITPGILFTAQGKFNHHLRLSCGAINNDAIKDSIEKLSKLLYMSDI